MKGKAHKFGDHVDTDQIAAAIARRIVNPEEVVGKAAV